MKKIVSMLLTFVMTLSLCVPAYAGGTAGTVALQLTGSAADQVENLKSGQRVATDSDVVVRLNVQSDPAAAEYDVTLNGEEVAADHSTSRYHFYYLPAAQLASGAATLSVDAAAALEGSGTEESPYLIYTAAQLGAFRDKVNTGGEAGAWARLMNSVALTGSWTPIGTAAKPYTGTFDGNGRAIDGLNVNLVSGSDNGAGLFGAAGEGAVIKGLTIAGGTVTIGKAGYAGAVVAHTTGAVTLSGCHTGTGVTVKADTATASSVGGLVGFSEGTLTVTECSNSAAVTGGAASANKGTGGLVGQAAAAFTIRQSFNAGSVSGTAGGNVGGLVGYAGGTAAGASKMTDVYSAGAVSGAAGGSVGGFIGKLDTAFAFDGVTTGYTRAAVTAGDGAGCAIVGSAAKEIPLTNVYKLDEAQEDVGGYVNNDDAIVRTEEELKGLAGTLGESWAAGTETLNDGFPVLKWQADTSGEKPVALQGSGTAEDPYRIPDGTALGLLRDKVNESDSGTAFYAVLTDDITLTGAWTAFETFTGQLDGQNHTIRGIQISATGGDQGLIRAAKGDVTIKNLTIADSSITVTQTRVGAFVGAADESGTLTLDNCHAADSVTVSAGNGIAGGLVGQTAGDVTITGCSSRAAVTGESAMNGIGGLVGHAYSGSGRTLDIRQSFHAGTVTGGRYAGGLVGQTSNGAGALTMADVYNVGTVSAGAENGAAGSLIGYLSSAFGNGATTITNAYSASANALLGKLDTGKPTTLANVYVLEGQAAAGTAEEGAALTGIAGQKTAEAMKESTFGKKALGVSFTRDFQSINGGYPVLKWQNGDTQEPVTLKGTGTQNDPYQLYDASDLAAFRDTVNNGRAGACAILMDDIDLQTENFTKSWTPIGTSEQRNNNYIVAYSGIFDGNGHTIRGIQIHNTGDTKFYAGLFGWTAQSTSRPVIKDLTISDSTIINEVGDAGGIVCYGGGVMENCHTTATVTVKGSDTVGGLAGVFRAYYAAEHPTMTNCSNRAAVVQINESTVVSPPRVGGLIGAPDSVVMTGCFNAGPVTAETANGSAYIGGLIGYTDQSDSSLTNVYNVGSVTAPNSGTMSIGGLVGHARRGLDITNAYQCGTVASKDGKGGVVGHLTSGSNVPMLLLNVYKTGQLADVLEKDNGAKVTNSATGVTVEELKGFTSELGMSFVADLTGGRQLNNGLPILEWQDPEAAASDFLTVAVKDVTRKVRLGSNGNVDPESPTLCEINIDNRLLSTDLADTIYLTTDNIKNGGDIRVGTGLGKDGLTGVLTAGDGAMTAEGLYFAKHPARQVRTVYVAYTRDDVTRYYQVNINRSGRSGVAYGASLTDPATSEDAPYIASVYDAETGYLTGAVDAGYRQFTDGAVSSESSYDISTTGTMEVNGFTVSVKGEDGTQRVAFARPGRYWAAPGSASSSYDKVPLAAWWGSADVAQKYLDKANALKADAVYDKLTDEVKADLEAVIAELEAGRDTIAEALPGRDALGARMTKEYELEKAENHLLDLMDIIGEWSTNAAVAADKYTALTRMEANLSVLSVLEITDEAGLTAYTANRGYIRAMLQAADRDGINAVLKKAKCSIIEGEVYVEPVTDVTLWIGEADRKLDISSAGSGDPAKPTEISVAADIPEDGRMERVSFVLPEGVQAGTGLSSGGVLSSALVQVDGRYTAENLFFSDQAAAKTLTAYLVYTEGGASHYYKVTVTRPAKTGLNFEGGMMGMGSPTYPYAIMSNTLSSAKSLAAMTACRGTTAVESNVSPVWDKDPNALVYVDDSNVYVKRHGWYWMPVSHTTKDGETASGYLTMEARMDIPTANKYIAAAEALESSSWYGDIPAEAKAMMAEAIAAVQAQADTGTLANELKYEGTSVYCRNYFGGKLHGTDQVEREANTILDLTAIFTTWGRDAGLAGYQWQAYQRIMSMDGAIHSVLGIESGADRDSYQTLRQAKWDLLQAADLDGVNAVLKGLGLETIEAVTTVEIGTAAELKGFRDRVNAGETTLHALLTADIDLNGEAWTPVGNSGSMYTGVFDGGGHTIRGLNVSGAVSAGLFTNTGDGAVIKNLTIASSTVSGQNYAGAFVGYSTQDVTLENCHTAKDVTVTVTVSSSATRAGGAGGLVGGLYAMTSKTDTTQPMINMNQCSNAAKVTGKGSDSNKGGIGGLIGTAPNGGTITNSCNIGTVTNESTGSYAAAGGLVGISLTYSWTPEAALTLTNVYNTGAVSVGGSGSEYVGGLVGNATWHLSITNAYGTMSVMRGTAYGGIIAGTAKNLGTISNGYAEMLRNLKSNSDCKIAIEKVSDSNLSKNVAKMWCDTEMPVAAEVLDKLGAAFKQDDANGTICGYGNYPVLVWQEAPVDPPAPPEPPVPEYTLGDVDGDGSAATFNDIIAAIQFFQDLKEPTERELMAGDIDGDGKIGFNDIIKMIRYFNGDIQEFNTQNS